uniref:Uncharacterized protein n=1 Tax=Strigamia maritima TaxID=126957 RepID=T1JIR9_STRMM
MDEVFKRRKSNVSQEMSSLTNVLTGELRLDEWNLSSFCISDISKEVERLKFDKCKGLFCAAGDKDVLKFKIYPEFKGEEKFFLPESAMLSILEDVPAI